MNEHYGNSQTNTVELHQINYMLMKMMSFSHLIHRICHLPWPSFPDFPHHFHLLQGSLLGMCKMNTNMLKSVLIFWIPVNTIKLYEQAKNKKTKTSGDMLPLFPPAVQLLCCMKSSITSEHFHFSFITSIIILQQCGHFDTYVVISENSLMADDEICIGVETSALL